MPGRRRDIGNSIIFFGLLLILLIGYHGWFGEPGPVPQSSQPVIDRTFATTPPPSPSPAPDLPAPVFETPVPDIGEAQVIEPSEPPSATYAELLNRIRTLIEQRDAAGAQAQLATLPHEVFLDPDLRPYVAVLWNNLGVLQRSLHGAPTAIPSYITGVDLDPTSPALNLNLAHAYWETKDSRLTQAFLQKLVTLAPHDPFPHIALADLLYGEDDLAGAARELDRAAHLAQADPKLAGHLQMVRAKVEGTQRTEDQFVARESSHFVVKFDGDEDYAMWDEVLDILEEAYRDIGQRLGYFPSQPIHVLLMTRETFHGVEGTPAWADALFDPVLGRIKVPTQGALTDRAWLTRILRHEFVHALLHERMGLEAGTIPTWLNEGLAMQLTGDSWQDIDQLVHEGALRLIPLSALEKGWGSLPAEAAALAYLQAHSATGYMVTRFGMGRVREILDLLKSGHTISTAIHDKLMMTYDVFQKRWAQDLESRMTARRA